MPNVHLVSSDHSIFIRCIRRHRDDRAKCSIRAEIQLSSSHVQNYGLFMDSTRPETSVQVRVATSALISR